MFELLFSSRDKAMANIIKLSDYLGRSLRENLEVFSVDGNHITLISESNKVISGDINSKDGLVLENISIEDATVFSDDEKFDAFVDTKIKDFIGNINENSHIKAKTSFNDILDLWGSRLKFDSVTKRLEEKKELFEHASITDMPEFLRLSEVAPQISTFLADNREKVIKIAEIRNGIKLSNTVSKAFDIPMITMDDISESSFTVKDTIDTSIYDLVCHFELLRGEILESRKNFESIWATNESIRKLALKIYEEDENEIVSALVEAIIEVPYLALAKKGQLFETFSMFLGLNNDTIPQSDIKEYVSTIFEMNKPVKKDIIGILNEKYGINLSTLKDPASFRTLADTQVVVLEALSRIARWL